MRILFVTNFYPPHSNGGYEQLCQEVAHAFVGRGHEVAVITSRVARKSKVDNDGPVRIHHCFELELEGGLAQTAARLLISREVSERRSVACVERIVESFEPNAALIWGMWNVPKSVPATVERLLPKATSYYFCDYWPTLPNAYIQRLEEPARHRIADVAKRLMAHAWLPRLHVESAPSLQFRRTACVSHAVRAELVAKGLPMEQASIINNGIQPSTVSMRRNVRATESERCLRLVMAGRLTPEKGIHTALEAMRILKQDLNERIEMDIFGSGAPDYEASLGSLVREARLSVKFHGTIPRDQLLQRLADHDVLVLPSEWPEPLARTMMEAMAAGLAVVGTDTGGTGELLVDEETGLVFAAGDPYDLAHKLSRLVSDADLRDQVAQRGRARVLAEFDIRRTSRQLEEMLECTACESGQLDE